MSLRELLAYDILVSLAKWIISDVFIGRRKSFMYMRKNKGPKVEPCVEQYLTVWILYFRLLMVYTEFCA